MEKRKGTREKIVDAAIELFKNNPYDQVTVKEICTLAGVTRNSFYYYFDGKDTIFDAIGDWCSRTAKQRLPEVFAFLGQQKATRIITVTSTILWKVLSHD